MADDARLVGDAILGDEDAFRVLVERHGGMAAAVAYAVTGNAEAARDLVQDSFAEAYLSLRRLRSRTRFAAWVAGIVRRKAISWVRARARSRIEAAGLHEAFVESAPAPEASGADELEALEETRRRVLLAVRGLPPGYREVVVLRCLRGRSHAEICACLGVSAAAVDKRLTRAKAMLREALGDLAD